jgi:7,8-dihydropterin-6-yl-methyl-4-(beta-D-ribofuranosyl)aminobenzene 5'-phosphate synthase
MNFKILIDNNLNPKHVFESEHGLSVYFGFNGKKCLIDTGQSDRYIANAKKLKVNIKEIDILFISHGHFDHLGGLEVFLQNNSKAKVIISGNVLNQSYFSYRNASKRDIGKDLTFVNNYKKRFDFVNKDIELLPGLFVLTDILQDYAKPEANNKLYKKEGDFEVPDNFNHEIVVCTENKYGITVFTGCAHKGILNILLSVSKKFGNKQIRAVIGGFHLVDSDTENQFETNEEISLIAGELMSDYPNTMFYTGHCTGKHAFVMLKNKLDKQIDLFYSGFEKVKK